MKKMLILLIATTWIYSADHYVLPAATGSGNGSDWNNAYGGLPSTLTRGDTYWVGGGTYSRYVFDDAEVGTNIITIYKATASNHGTNTGWNNAYGEASWNVSDVQTLFEFRRGYYVIDGQTGTKDDTSAYGIKLYNSNNTQPHLGGNCMAVLWGQPIINNLTFRHIDVKGAGTGIDLAPDSGLTRLIYFADTVNSVRFQNCSFRNAGKQWINLACAGRDCLIEDCYFYKNGSNSADEHSNGLNLYGLYIDMNFIVRNNVFKDMVAVGATNYIQLGHYSINYPSGNYYVYGNVFIETDPSSGTAYPVGGIGDPLISNSIIANNTFVNLNFLSFMVFNNTDNVIAINNLIYNCTGAKSTTGCIDSNNFVSELADIFIDTVNEDFRLKVSQPGGTILSGTYGIENDPYGNVRGLDNVWDYGAFEFVSKVFSSNMFTIFDTTANPRCSIGIWKAKLWLDTSSFNIGPWSPIDSFQGEHGFIDTLQTYIKNKYYRVRFKTIK